MSPRGIALILLCNLIWSLNVIVSRVAVSDLGAPPIAYAFLRSVIVMVVLAPLLRPTPEKLWRVMLVGLAISGGSFALLFMGLETASPSAAGIVGLTGAPMTVLFAILFLGERVRWRRALGIALAFIGVLIAVSGRGAAGATEGLLLVFAGAVVGALGSVFVKRIDIGSVRLQAWAALASVLVLGPLSVATEAPIYPVFGEAPLELIGCLFFAAIVTSVGAHSIYYRLLQDNDANLVVPLTLLSPLFTVALGAWLTNDIVGINLIIGAAIAVVGVAIIVLRPSETFSKRLLVRGRL
ncbi:DMT family transporter [Qipengyuania sp.]|uniref:DMT family transporter n=1 Tax=Qipengyuania sp. TaxID=2004515 RepID=UPI0035C85EEA